MSNLRQAAQQELCMTDREVMQQALDALHLPSMKTQQMLQQRDETIATLRAQLEQQAEPVHGDIRALRYRIFALEGEVLGYKRMLDVAEAPPQRTPLSDEQIMDIVDAQRAKILMDEARVGYRVARAIEKAHGIGEKP